MSSHLFVHAEGVLGLVDDATASTAGRSLVLVAGHGIAHLLRGDLSSFGWTERAALSPISVAPSPNFSVVVFCESGFMASEALSPNPLRPASDMLIDLLVVVGLLLSVRGCVV